jgi:hypothetical protein
MTNGKRLLFSMGLMGVLVNGCGMETHIPGDAQRQAVNPGDMRLSSASAAASAGCSGPTASLLFLPNGVADGSEEVWPCSRFRFEIGGLPTSGIAALDGRVALAPPSSVDGRVALAAPTIGPGDLKLTISMADYDSWYGWAKKWFIDTRDTEPEEKPATLTLLGPDLQEELATIRFSRVGVLALKQGVVKAISLEKVTGSTPSQTQGVEQFTVELYAEEPVIDWLD